MRKEADFEVTDHIAISYEGNDKMNGIMERNADVIKGSVLGEEVKKGLFQGKGYAKEWDINGETLTISIAKK